jgi:hypothetical protein
MAEQQPGITSGWSRSVKPEEWATIIAMAATFGMNDLFGYPMRFAATLCFFFVFTGLTAIRRGPDAKRKMFWVVCGTIILFLFLELTHTFSRLAR